MNAAGAAYDRVAPEYDGLFVERGRRIWSALYSPYLHPGAEVIDAGCGTGSDSLICARAGCRVRGFDASVGMLERAERRAEDAGLVIDFRPGRLEDLATLYEPGSADLVLSGFAALNTCGDLRAFGEGCARVLRPGGHLIVHFLTPGGLYDRVGNLARGRVRLALGGWSGREVEVRVGDVSVRHYLWPTRQVEALCGGRDLVRVSSFQVGLLTPDDGPTRVPALAVAALDAIEEAARPLPWLAPLGRFSVLGFRRSGPF